MYLDMAKVAEYCAVTGSRDQVGLTDDATTACQWVEDQAGPIEQRSVTERAWSTGSYVRLTETPAAITSIDGSADGVDQLALTPSGISGGVTPGWRTVVYQVGAATPPQWAVSAAMAMTKHLWQSRLGSRGNSGSINYGSRAEALISGYLRGPRP